MTLIYIYGFYISQTRLGELVMLGEGMGEETQWEMMAALGDRGDNYGDDGRRGEKNCETREMGGYQK